MIPSPFHGIFSSVKDGAIRDGGQVQEKISPEPVRTGFESSKTTGSGSRSTGIGQVALDIFEYDDYYILKAPMAGVRLSDLDIEVNDNVLTIRGNRRQADTIPDEQYYLKECFWGEFQRSVTLPCSIDPRKIKATFNKDCVLKVLVPKEEKVKIIRISE